VIATKNDIGRAGGPIPTFATHRSGHFLRMLELKDHQKILILVELWI